MHRSILHTSCAAAVSVALFTVPGAHAQGNPPGTVTWSYALTGTQQLSGTFDRGGDVHWGSLAVSGGVARQFVPAFAAGLSVRCDDETWRFRHAAAFGSGAPWRHLQRPGASLNLSLALSRTFVVGVSPTADWAYDSQAGAADACTYGAVFSAFRVFSPRFVLGGGASVTRQFYSVKTSPFVIVNWKLGDRVRIANAPSGSPLGGAGVELRYAPAADWELAAGGVWRSDRWRLAPRAGSAGDVAETSAIPLLARLSHRIGAKTRIDIYAGAALSNTLKTRDAEGRPLARDDFGVVPVISAAWSGKF